MKRSLRKTTIGLSVTYSNGSYSNNLMGANITLEESKDSLFLCIDLSSNLRVRNKASNCYYDACELVEQHSSLKSVQIHETQVIDGLVAAHQKIPAAYWKLELTLGERGVFKYFIEPTESNGSVFLNVRANV